MFRASCRQIEDVHKTQQFGTSVSHDVSLAPYFGHFRGYQRVPQAVMQNWRFAYLADQKAASALVGWLV